jgi:protoporphyrinogen oxidase
MRKGKTNQVLSEIQDRIAIVGGGFSGLLLAEGLQKKGYSNVTLFEASDRLGGKLHTVWYRGKSYELGAVFGLPAQKRMKAFMKAHGIKADGPRLARVYSDSNGQNITQIPKASLGTFLQELDRLQDVLASHPSLNNVNLIALEHSLTLTFSVWCDMNQFIFLKTVYAHYFTSYGLGDIEVLPAIYVLSIMNYDTLMAFMEIPEFCTWKDGVTSLINSLEAQVRDIRLSQKVIDVSFDENRKALIVQTEFEKVQFDKVILAAPLNQFANVFHFDREMQAFLKGIKYQSYSVYLIAAKNVPKGCGCITENLSTQRRGHLVIWHTRWEQTDVETLVTVYAYDHPGDSWETSYDRIETDLIKLGIVEPKLYRVKRWQQCPYVEPKDLQNGFYEKLEAMQGVNNLYLAGEIISTVSMENCLRHTETFIERHF